MSNATITFTGCPTCAGPVQAIADGDAVIYRHADLSDAERIKADETPLPVAYANTHHFKQVNDGFLAMRKPSEFHNVPLFTHPPAQPTKLEDAVREVVALLRATSNTPASDRRYAAGLLTAALQENAK